MRKAKILKIAISNFVHTSKFFAWPHVIMLAGADLDWMQSTTIGTGVQQQTDFNPIKIVFAGNIGVTCIVEAQRASNGGRCGVARN